jgi:hypothetical protein
MALEDAINNLAEAINRYVDIHGTPPKVEAPKEVKKSPPKETVAPPAATLPDTTTSTVGEGPTEQPEAEPENISETFFAKANELIQLDVEKAKIVLTELGFAKFKLVPANKHAKGLKLVEAQLNG